MPPVRLKQVVLAVLAFAVLAFAAPSSALAGITVDVDSPGGAYTQGDTVLVTATYTNGRST